MRELLRSTFFLIAFVAFIGLWQFSNWATENLITQYGIRAFITGAASLFVVWLCVISTLDEL